MFKSSSLVILFGIIDHRVMANQARYLGLKELFCTLLFTLVSILSNGVQSSEQHWSSSINSAHYAFGMVHPYRCQVFFRAVQ